MCNYKNIFFLFGRDLLEVKIPSHCYNGEIYFQNETGSYSNFITEKPFKLSVNIEVTIDIPPGDRRFFFDIEYNWQQFSYILTFVGKSTREKKIMEGKFIRIEPTGNFSKL